DLRLRARPGEGARAAARDRLRRAVGSDRRPLRRAPCRGRRRPARPCARTRLRRGDRRVGLPRRLGRAARGECHRTPEVGRPDRRRRGRGRAARAPPGPRPPERGRRSAAALTAATTRTMRTIALVAGSLVALAVLCLASFEVVAGAGSPWLR